VPYLAMWMILPKGWVVPYSGAAPRSIYRLSEGEAGHRQTARPRPRWDRDGGWCDGLDVEEARSGRRCLRRLHLFQAAGRCQPAVPVSPKPNRLAPASRFTGDCPAEAGAHTPIHGRFSGLRATPGDHKQRRIA
jgi:hypothetical protein